MFDYAPVARGFVSAREKLGWSHYRLAKEAGLPFATVVRLENENAKPALNTIARVAKALGYHLRLHIIDKGGPLE